MKRIQTFDRRSGVALASAVVTVFTTAALVAVLLTMAVATDRSSAVTRGSSQAQYLADGAVEAASKEIQIAIANWQEPDDGGTIVIGDVPVTYTITPLLDGSGKPTQTTLTDASGIQTIVTSYEISATAVVGDNVARASRVVNAEATPIFQFAVFYTSDLEVNPGPDMTLGGRVHSNGNIHLAPGAKLTLDTNYVRAVGGIYRCRKDNPLESTGHVEIRKWVANPFDPSATSSFAPMYSKSELNKAGADSFSGYDSLFTVGHDGNSDGDYDDVGDFEPFATGAVDMWGPADKGAKGQTVTTSAHWSEEAVTPSIGSIKMFEEVDAGAGDYVKKDGEWQYVGSGNGDYSKGFYHSKAALSFIVDGDGKVKITGPDGMDKNADGKEYKDLLAGTYTVKTIYDARQAEQGSGYVKVVEIDMSKLNPLIDPKGTPVIDFGDAAMDKGGIVLYAGFEEAGTGVNTGGLKVKKASELALPMTLVSESPIYVQGDFNTGGATYPKKGAAAISDAVNLLSNAWNDSKTHKSSLPSASNTTFNLALITGNQNSKIGAYNGGLENLPRFHENWGGKTCTIEGSFVNTWFSELATGSWVYGGKIYTAPNRDFRYDTDFNDISNLPPFTPVTVVSRDVVTW